MDWRHRRYFCIRLPSTTQYVYNKYMKLIKSVPTVKVHPVKYNMIQKFPTKLKSSFSDEIEPRGYHNITVSVYGIEETKWLLAGLEMMCRDRWTGAHSNYKEILPRSK